MNPNSDLQLVPETLLKKRHDLDALQAKRAAEAITNPRVSRKRISDKSKKVKVVKAETILIQSRHRKNAKTRFNRVKKVEIITNKSPKVTTNITLQVVLHIKTIQKSKAKLTHLKIGI